MPRPFLCRADIGRASDLVQRHVDYERMISSVVLVFYYFPERCRSHLLPFYGDASPACRARVTSVPVPELVVNRHATIGIVRVVVPIAVVTVLARG